MTPATTRSLFYSVLAEAEQNIDKFVNKPGVDMTRHRSCSFTDTVLSTITLSMGRTNTELFNFFSMKKQHIPSKSSYSQQRQKINPMLFPYILNRFNESATFNKTFKGFHLLAVDGTDLNIPTDRNDTIYRIKQARSDRFYYQMHINALYDICENRYMSLIIQPRPEMNEHAAFLQLVKERDFFENTIFIADRGFCSLNTIANLYSQNKLFLIRSKSPDSPASFLRNMLEAGNPCDRVASVAVTRCKKNCKKISCDVVKCIRKDRRFDLISPDDDTAIYHMDLRCTCIELTAGNYEYLFSNLPMDLFSADDLKALYWKRWAIETSFRSLKYALSLSSLHSVKRELIIQEIYAKVILYNFVSLIHAYAQQSKELLERNARNRYKSNVSFDDAVPVCRSFLLKKMKNDIIKTLLLRHLTEIRMVCPPTRQVRSQTVKPLNNRA